MRRTNRNRPPARQGFLLTDMLIAIGLIMLLSGLLATSNHYARRGADHLADGRAATAAAEAALAAMAAGQATPAGVTVERVGPAEPPVPGQAWVRVTAVVHGRRASLVGLAPAGR